MFIDMTYLYDSRSSGAQCLVIAHGEQIRFAPPERG